MTTPATLAMCDHPSCDANTYADDIDQLVPERVEYTADDLDQLPEGACAWDEDGDVWQRRAACWFMAGSGHSSTNPLRDGVCCHLYSAPKN